MKVARWVGSAGAALALLVLAQGCIFGDNAAEKEERICTPGANVFCRCADRTEGTKLCTDGTRFEACTVGGGGECAGGEIEDPNTGRPVDDGGNVVEEDASTIDVADSCPGKPTAVTPDTDIVIEGDTTDATDAMKGKSGGACAAGGGGPEHVYRLQPTGTGSLTIKVQGEGDLNPVAYLRSTCDDEESQISCAPPLGAGKLIQTQINVVNGQEYFLVVDGASGSTGKYLVTLRLQPGGFCGDGKVGTNEACDDGNKVEGDGCSNNCQRIDGNPPSGDNCPGHPVHVWPGRTVTGTGSTSSNGNSWTNTGTSCTVSTNNLNIAPEHVYEVTPHASGTLRVNLSSEPGVNLMLIGRRTCTDPTSQSPSLSMCSNSGGPGGTEAMEFSVTSGKKVYVAVDGSGGNIESSKNSGGYSISFRIQ
jgi:cysteine-rich repeat protein